MPSLSLDQSLSPPSENLISLLLKDIPSPNFSINMFLDSMPLHLTGELASLIILSPSSAIFLSPPALFLQPSSGHSLPNIVDNFNWPFGSTILSSPSFPCQRALRSCLKKDSTSSFPTKGLALIQPSCLPFSKICSGFGIQDSHNQSLTKGLTHFSLCHLLTTLISSLFTTHV